MERIRSITSKTAVLPVDNVDTDQIIPARFLTTTGKKGLGEALFADWRGDPDFVLNREEAKGAAILVAGENFGCGSSREHAPWALIGYGFRAIVSRSLADIFKANALKNGLLPVEVPAEAHRKLLESPGAVATVDLERRVLVLPDGSEVMFPVDGFARHCLLEGIDPLDFLLQQESAIRSYEARSR
ncbi:MAG TPA: 3-isopropylmalate dehydratase small subunit [Vicinamibacteria bacterium]